MLGNQYIVICLDDKTEENPSTYIQATRKRFTYQEALEYMFHIAPSRQARIVPVENVPLDENGYPIFVPEEKVINP